MKRICLTLILLSGILCTAFGQTTVSLPDKFSIGIEGIFPVSNAGLGYDPGFGASAKYEIPTSAKVYVTLSGGYVKLPVKPVYQDLGSPSSFSFIPLKAGFKGYIDDGFFAEGQIGAAFSTATDGSVAFAYSPGVGYTLNKGIEFGLRYEGWVKNGTLGQIALRLAFRF